MNFTRVWIRTAQNVNLYYNYNFELNIALAVRKLIACEIYSLLNISVITVETRAETNQDFIESKS